MAIQQTSIEAYQSIQPTLNQRQKQIYQIIKTHPGISNNEIKRITKLGINQITPRVYELRQKGLVRCRGIKIDRITKRAVMCWEATQ